MSSSEYMRQWRRKNREHVNEYNRRYRKEHPELKEWKREYDGKYRQSHREECREASRRYRERNRERIKEYGQKYSKEHRQQRRIANFIWKHKEDYPLSSQCIFCSSTENLEHAHLDYEDEGHNYVTACRSCHMLMDHGKISGNEIEETLRLKGY